MALSSAYYKQEFKVIGAVKRLVAGKHIYLVEVDDGSHLVLKQEGGSFGPQTAANIKFANNAMKTVSDGMMAKPLSSGEKLVVRHFVDDSKDIADICLTDEDPDVVAMRTGFNANNNWVKMQKIDGIYTLESAMKEMSGDPTKGTPGNKTGIRKFAAALNAPHGFETLGQIVTIDLFTGNEDRFSATGSNVMNPRTNQPFKTIINTGNVMLVMKDDVPVGKVVGMDAYNPWTQSGKFSNANLAKNSNAGDEVFMGHMLSSQHKNRLSEYFKNIVEDLEDVWGPRNRKFFLLSKKRLDSKAVQRMMAGAEIAKQKLKVKLQSMANKPGANMASIQARLAVLNA